ncbi:hypothetical protein ACS5PN_12885 [Roseateles sp. NT4]|uniref:hypothetical protein n=1 Tax=Roseateles sp. NT4 TaxID=3453715 RepID=UPI003EE8F4A1
MGATDELDELLLQDALLESLEKPVWGLFGLTLAAVIGLMGHFTALAVVGWMATWVLGPWVISRAAPALDTSPLVKYPLFLSCAVPFLSLLAPLYVWQASKTRREELATGIRQAELRERRRGPAPADAAAAPAAPRAPIQEALPIVRGVANGLGADGNELEMRVTPGQLPDHIPNEPGMLPPARATGGVFIVGYHVDAGSHWTSVGRDEMRAAGMNLDVLHRQSLSNLMKLVKGQPGLRLVENPPYYGLLLDGDHEACLVLLDGLWDHLFADKTPNGAVVAIPSRDVLAFCDANSAEGIAALREANRRIGTDATGALTQQLLRRRDGRWTVLES